MVDRQRWPSITVITGLDVAQLSSCDQRQTRPDVQVIRQSKLSSGFGSKFEKAH